MKIEIEIPNWAAEQFISVMAGGELVAYKKPNDTVLYVKTDRCDSCGKCCMSLSKQFFLPTTDGVCDYLGHSGDKYLCTVYGKRPGACERSDPVLFHGEKSHGVCSIRYKKIEIEE